MANRFLQRGEGKTLKTCPILLHDTLQHVPDITTHHALSNQQDPTTHRRTRQRQYYTQAMELVRKGML